MTDFERFVRPSVDEWRALLGRKVSLRYALPGEGDGRSSEAIGVVMTVHQDEEGSRIEILKKSGDVAVVPVEDVVAGKAWPVAR